MTIHRANLKQRVLFVRIGWMKFYNGPVAGDARPIGGGSHNETGVGHELYNFRKTDGRLYGYFQPAKASTQVLLERIDRKAAEETVLNDVLVIFVARNTVLSRAYL